MIPTATLGDTGLVVSRLGLGLAAVGRPGYINLGRERDLPDRSPEALYARTAELLDAGRDRGVRYVDVARSYGRAEQFLARWLRERAVPPDALTVGSKWGYQYTADWRVDAAVHEQKELSLQRFTTQLAETRGLLREHLDLFQIHSATAESGVLGDAAVLRALVDGRRRGAYRAVGLTLTGVGSAHTLELALGARVDGDRVFDTVQATFNVLEPSLAEPLAAARAEGVGVIVKEAFANGRLTPANTRAEDAAMLRRLDAVAADTGCGRDQLAVAFVLAHPFVDVMLSGAATMAQLVSHADGVRIVVDPSALAALAEPPSRYWTTRGGLRWS